MTLRWKLNLSVAVLIAVLLTAIAISMYAVSNAARQSRSYSRMRSSAQFTSDLRTLMFEQVAAGSGAVELKETDDLAHWPRYALDDIDVQIRLASEAWERHLWQNVAVAIEQMGTPRANEQSNFEVQEALDSAERFLRELRLRYDFSEQNSMAAVASTSFIAQVAVAASCILAMLLFLVFIILVRDWLVRPVETLKTSAEIIGKGNLDHRVPLAGQDEFAQLGQRLDAMAESLKRHQKALVESSELSAIGEVCTNVAHGLRNPLAAMRACAQLVSRCLPANDESHERLKDLIAQIDRLDNRINKLFEIGRPCSPVYHNTSFADLAKRAERETGSLLQTSFVSVVIEDETQGRHWSMDRERLSGALSEIISNAIYHSPPDSSVTLRGKTLAAVDGLGPTLVVEVEDHGTGMPQATMEKAFDLFFTGRQGGTGVGLNLARRVVERHGGRVELDSSPGKGTTVRLTIPG